MDFPKVTFLAGTLGLGGAERQLFYVLQALQQCSARPHLLCLTRREFWEQRCRALGVPVTWVGATGCRPMRLARMLTTLRKNPPEILQSQHFYGNLYVAAAARLLGLKEIGAIRGDLLNEVGNTGQLLGRLCLRAPRRIAANSRAAIQVAVRLGVSARRLHFLPNVVDTDDFKPGSAKRDQPVTIIAVGSLGRPKRYDRLLSILAGVRRRAAIEIRAIVVGDGPLRQKLEQQATALALPPEVLEFRGAVHDTRPVYREADIMVLTSDFEGTPNVVLEAMASGLPVVATRVGDVSDIVQDGNTGFLADPSDENRMIDTLLTLIQDSELRARMGRRGREYVEAHHSLRRLPQNLEDLYARVMA